MGTHSPPALPAADLLDALAALFLRRPSRDTLEAAAATPAFDARGDDLDAVLADYHELFFVPVSGRYVPPFESAQRDGSLGGPRSRQVAEAYAAAGFDVAGLTFDRRWGRVPPGDHVGCELAFVAALQRGAEASRDRALSDTAASFWRAHPETWLGDFGRAVAAMATSALYRRAGVLTAELAHGEAEFRTP